VAARRGDAGSAALALRDLLDRPSDDAEVVAARAAAMRADPISSILAARNPEGWWAKPGHGYSPKYTGTCGRSISSTSSAADGSDRAFGRPASRSWSIRSRAAAASGRWHRGWPGRRLRRPSLPERNLLRALIGFGLLDDPRVARSLAWERRAITGGGEIGYYKSTTAGPGFRCGIQLR